jgi:hypothetical protein
MVAYPFLPLGGVAEKLFPTAGYAASFLSSPIHNFQQYLTPKTHFCGSRPYLCKGKAKVMTNDIGESGMSPTESKTTRTVGNLSHGSRETPETSTAFMAADRSEKARCHKSDMHVAGESDSSIVPKKPANKSGERPQAESVEGRGLTKENISQSLLDRTQGRNADGKPFVPRSRGLWGVRQTQRAVCTSTSAVGAVCGSSARTDLCGGWPERAIPTAIASPYCWRLTCGKIVCPRVPVFPWRLSSLSADSRGPIGDQETRATMMVRSSSGERPAVNSSSDCSNAFSNSCASRVQFSSD